MMSSSNFAIAAAVISFVVFQTPCCSQSIESIAEESLADTISAVTLLPNEYAVVVRESYLSLKDANTTERIFLFSENRTGQSRARFSADSATSKGNYQARWTQYIRTPAYRARRSDGSPVPPYTGEIIESTSVDPEESKLIQYPRGHYLPYFRPIAYHADVLLQRVHVDSYGSYLLSELNLVEASRTKENLIHSICARGTWYILIDFDPKQDNRPVRIVHAKELSETNEVLSLDSVQIIRWAEWELNSGKKIWVPMFCRLHHTDTLNATEYETEMHLRWKEARDESVIPDCSDFDWRERIRTLFAEDWSMSYANWVRQNAETR